MTLLKANRDLQRLGIKRSRIESPASGNFCSPLFLGMDLCFPCLKHRGKKTKVRVVLFSSVEKGSFQS